ncbi:MAG: DUF6079 family protein, partial [Candidatus Odinarchaeota archaeon]
MKYSDIANFEAITTVIQIQEVDDNTRAKELIKTLVISGGMEERINSLFIPNVQFQEIKDNKGVLIIGNYGTGKSHLMSVLSKIAEDASMMSFL